jgi:hypothetical protein
VAAGTHMGSMFNGAISLAKRPSWYK